MDCWSKSTGWKIWWHMILLFALLNVGVSRSNVKTLPGYSGTLPSKLETGYISVGDFDEIELFYYFFESEGRPETDPLLIWFVGGPACSGLSSFIDRKSPLIFDDESLFSGSLPILLRNPHTFVKVASVIFIDELAYTGFSYSTTKEGYFSNDTKLTKDASIFIRKWLLDHPEFDKNPLYIGGDSHGGNYVPIIVTHVSEAIEAGDMPNTNLQGYILGNPFIDKDTGPSSRVPYAHLVALISDDYFESVKSSCQGDYSRRDPTNTKCLLDLQRIDKCTEAINIEHILEPTCMKDGSQTRDELKWRKQFPEGMILLPSQKEQQPKPCLRDLRDMLCAKWANDPGVQQALHIRNGTLTSTWSRCHFNWSGFVHDVPNVIKYHQMLSKKGYRALIYSGDHDMVTPYIDTLAWIHKLNLSTDEPWRPWFVDNQVAGYTETYGGNNGFSLTFATVKGAGHIAPEYKPKEVSAMVKRWFSHIPL